MYWQGVATLSGSWNSKNTFPIIKVSYRTERSFSEWSIAKRIVFKTVHCHLKQCYWPSFHMLSMWKVLPSNRHEFALPIFLVSNSGTDLEVDWLVNDAVNIPIHTGQSIHKTSTQLELEMHTGRKAVRDNGLGYSQNFYQWNRSPSLKDCWT